MSHTHTNHTQQENININRRKEMKNRLRCLRRKCWEIFSVKEITNNKNNKNELKIAFHDEHTFYIYIYFPKGVATNFSAFLFHSVFFVFLFSPNALSRRQAKAKQCKIAPRKQEEATKKGPNGEEETLEKL